MTGAEKPQTAQTENATDDRPLAAAGWMLGAICGFSLMAVAGREVAAYLDTFELMTYRSIVGIAIVLMIAVLRRGKPGGGIRMRRMKLHLARNIAHFTGQNLWFFAVTMIPLAQLSPSSSPTRSG